MGGPSSHVVTTESLPTTANWTGRNWLERKWEIVGILSVFTHCYHQQLSVCVCAYVYVIMNHLCHWYSLSTQHGFWARLFCQPFPGKLALSSYWHDDLVYFLGPVYLGSCHCVCVCVCLFTANTCDQLTVFRFPWPLLGCESETTQPLMV